MQAINRLYRASPHGSTAAAGFASGVALVLIVLGVLAIAIGASGCAQNTESAQPTVSQQAPAAPTDQHTATPTRIVIHIDPWNGALADARGTGGERAAIEKTAAEYTASMQDGTQSYKGPPATFTQTNNIWVDTSSTGSSGATATASAAGTQTQNPNQTISPVQEPRPVFNAALTPQIGAAPRMVLEQTAAGEGGTATGGAQTADQSGATTVTQIKALNDRLQQLFDWVAAFTGQKPPEAPPPTTSPADGSS